MQSPVLLTEVGTYRTRSRLNWQHAAWRISWDDMPPRATLPPGRGDVGEAGIRVLGLFWLGPLVLPVLAALLVL